MDIVIALIIQKNVSGMVEIVVAQHVQSQHMIVKEALQAHHGLLV